jgi:hypothetical protein
VLTDEEELEVVLGGGGAGFDTWDVVAEVTTRDIRDGPGPPEI